MATYKPEPIDTSHVELRADLGELVESLARNNHDNWALQRIGEGWRYGTARNDERKEHPDLVPYHELPDSEREYDRRTVIDVLRALMALGYEVRKRD